MITEVEGKNVLSIFESFQKLPIKKTQSNNTQFNVGSVEGIVMSGTGQVGFNTLRSRFNISKLIRKIRTARFSPKKFFNKVKHAQHELVNYANVSEKVEEMIKQAEENHQTALAEKLKEHGEVVRRELLLINNGFITYVKEADIVTFGKNSSRSVKLDWIKNFCRIIPLSVLKKLNQADKLQVFDNYVILHYDPKDTGSALTKKEIERKKDPILFGVISGSRKLYFIDDWIDEICDLTLEELVEKTLNINETLEELNADEVKTGTGH